MNNSMLILCNRWHPIPQSYEVQISVLPGGLQMDSRVVPAYEAFMNELAAQGLRAEATSAYRTWEEQEAIMQEWVEVHLAEGHEPSQARALAERRVAIPGTSEHQLGLALDIEPIDAADEEAVYGWMAHNAHRFGFILRYPADKTQITGIDYEPWHFRYVGQEAAQEIYQRRCCLEEYLQA